MPESIFHNFTLKTSILLLSSLFLGGLFLSVLSISEINSTQEDKDIIKSINIVNGITGIIAFGIGCFTIYLLKDDIKDLSEYLYFGIGLTLLILSITQFAYISKLSDNFSSTSDLNICTGLVLMISLIFIGYAIYLYKNNNNNTPTPKVETNDVLTILENKLIKVNNAAETVLKMEGVNSTKYHELKDMAKELQGQIEDFAREHEENVKRRKDVKKKTDAVRGIGGDKDKIGGALFAENRIK